MNWRSLLTSSCMGGWTNNMHLHRCTCMWMRKTTLWIDVLSWPVLARVGGPKTYTCIDAPVCEWRKPPYELMFLADQFLRGWEDLKHTRVCTPARKWGKPPYGLTFLAEQFLHEWEDLQHTPPHTHMHAHEENSLMNWCPLLTSSCTGGRTYNIHLHRYTCMWMKKTTLWIDVLGWSVLARVRGPTTYTGLHRYTCKWMKKTLWTDILDWPVLAWAGGPRTYMVYTGTHARNWEKQPFELMSLADHLLHGREDPEHRHAQKMTLIKQSHKVTSLTNNNLPAQWEDPQHMVEQTSKRWKQAREVTIKTPLNGSCLSNGKTCSIHMHNGSKAVTHLDMSEQFACQVQWSMTYYFYMYVCTKLSTLWEHLMKHHPDVGRSFFQHSTAVCVYVCVCVCVMNLLYMLASMHL